MAEKNYDEIELIFSLKQEEDIIKCHIKEKFDNMLDVYCRIKNINKESVIFLYGGQKIDKTKYEATLDELANKQSKSDRKILILVYYLPKKVFIVFSHLGDSYKEKQDIEVKINIAFSGYLQKEGINKDNVILRYENSFVDINQTINQFITKQNNIDLSKIFRTNNDEEDNDDDADNDKNLIEIKLDVIDIHEVSKIISFSHKNEQYKENYGLSKKMGDIFNDFASKFNLDINKVEFKNNGISIKKNQTLNEFIKNNNNNINNNEKDHNNNQTLENIKIDQNKENESIINIDVIDLSFPYYLFNTYKKLIFIILGIMIVVFITILIFVLVLKKDGNNPSSPISSTNQIIPNDYFINATYFSNEFETIRLISDEYDLKKIKNMSIDGKITNPTKSYTFKEYGQHNIYYSFNYLSEKSLLSEGRGIFNGITKLIYIKASNFSENYPDVSFQGMFNNCINLLSVDFSEMKLNNSYYYIFYTSDFYEYYNSMDYMFNNCSSLTSINFDFKEKSDSNNMNIISSKFMFNNCIFLTYLYLPKIKFYKNLNNMFSNCISLKTLILSDFNYIGSGLNMSYMFYNCTSLDSLIFPSEGMNLPNDMSYSFAYCSSLKKLDLEFSFVYYDDFNYKNTMSSIFRNCTSLISVGLKFELYYEDMSYAFMGCSSLENIETKYRKNYFFAKYLNGMFIDCYSLYDFYFIENAEYYSALIDISYMFSGSSVRIINLSNFWTPNITNYEGLFYGCENLSSVDLSSFTHNNLPDSNLSIFKGNYIDYTILVINKEFLNRIQVPPNFEIKISENNTNF